MISCNLKRGNTGSSCASLQTHPIPGSTSVSLNTTARQMPVRQKSLPDDVFRTTICRPNGLARKAERPPRPFSLEEESNRKLCNAVIDRKLDELRSLLEDAGLDVNARDKAGNTAGHQVGGGHIVPVQLTTWKRGARLRSSKSRAEYTMCPIDPVTQTVIYRQWDAGASIKHGHTHRQFRFFWCIGSAHTASNGQAPP